MRSNGRLPGFWSRVHGCVTSPATSCSHGFDEVVVFETKPVALAPPPTTFTSDRSLSAHARSELLAYLERVGAVAAAGDGSGLNWFRRTAQI